MTAGGAKRLLIGCIADDFTGASDAASFLRRAGLDTVLTNGTLPEMPAGCRPDAVVTALKSRSVPAQEAVRMSLEAAEWLLDMGAEHLYFKYCSTFDSTPAGNIGPVTDALLERAGERYTVLCPSLPVNGRTVRDGVLYVSGVPLAESHMRFHPINPMHSSFVPELMAQQSAYPCLCLPPEKMASDDPAGAITGRFTLVPDYVTDEDGRRIAARFGHLRLLTGGSGLLEHLGRLYLPEKDGPGPAEEPCCEAPGRRLLLAGSCSEMTQRQVRRYVESGGEAVRIRPDLLCSGEQTWQTLSGAIAAAEGDIFLYSTADAASVSRYQALGAERVSRTLEQLMGRLAVFGREQGFRRIIAAGGETSGAVIRALGYSAFRIGAEAAPGVPEMTPLEQPQMRLILKSGNFGDEDFFLTALAGGR